MRMASAKATHSKRMKVRWLEYKVVRLFFEVENKKYLYSLDFLLLLYQDKSK
jgi:hypothetical protein